MGRRAEQPADKAQGGVWAALREPDFRRIWPTSVLANLGMLVGGVAAAWSMTQLTDRADMVALVQSATMAPVMLLAVVSGALADMYDRRRVGMVGISVSLAGALGLTVVDALGRSTPAELLAFTFTIGVGLALFAPAWQASVSEQVPASSLPSAVALNGISFNIARSFGPAIGGLLVAMAGATAAFLANVLLYIPALVAFARWRRRPAAASLPRERLDRAIVVGLRYAGHCPEVRVVVVRTLLNASLGCACPALLPLVVKSTLHGDARTYGFLLGAYGCGAVLGAMNIGSVRRVLSEEGTVRACSLAMGAAMLVLSMSIYATLSGAALVVAGGAWTITVISFNVGVQMASPQWVAARALSLFQAAMGAGLSLGAWGWGLVAERVGVQPALIAAALAMAASAVAGLWLRMPTVERQDVMPGESLAEPEAAPLDPRSGPIVVQVQYRIPEAAAADFHRLMLQVEGGRLRAGAYGWSLCRNLSDPEHWIERFHCPTWLDYLRQRNRATRAERAKTAQAQALHQGPDPVRVERFLERPRGTPPAHAPEEARRGPAPLDAGF